MKTLHQACREGDKRLIRFCIRESPDTLNSWDRHGRTPLIVAIEHRQADAAKLLLDHGGRCQR
jgi:ankyrin repeat protein